MSFVRKALSTAKSSLYDVVTPATLSGAVDVIVVARTDDAGEVQLACSPFHVRFGKLSVWAPVDRKVRVGSHRAGSCYTRAQLRGPSDACRCGSRSMARWCRSR